MDKYTEALLSSMKAQRDAALDEVARLNATLIVTTIEMNSVSKRLESAKSVIAGAFELLPPPLDVVDAEGEPVGDSAARKLLAEFLVTHAKE